MSQQDDVTRFRSFSINTAGREDACDTNIAWITIKRTQQPISEFGPGARGVIKAVVAACAAKLVPGETAKKRSKVDVNRLQQVHDLFFTSFLGESYTMNTSHLRKSRPREVPKQGFRRRRGAGDPKCSHNTRFSIKDRIRFQMQS